jgi:3-phosphoshikimate 1-carboxyvinyltransferase
MALPDLIEIVPLAAPVRAEITVPGSKSITNRALILAALADGEVTLKGALWSEDTQIMVACLKELGFVVHVTHDPEEPGNRMILVVGEGGLVPAGGTESEPLNLFVGNAGTAARFLAPFLCLGSGVYRLQGVKRMHERPQAALLSALRELGYRVESENDNEKLPVRIFAGPAGQTPQSYTQFERRKAAPAVPKKCRVSIEESSQFASALLLSAGIGGWQVEIVGENADESPYVAMTSKLIEAFPKNGGTFQIEPDASSGSYFWAAGQINPQSEDFPELPELKQKLQLSLPEPFRLGHVVRGGMSDVEVLSWPQTGWQIDEKFKSYLVWGPLFHDFPTYLKQLLTLVKGGVLPDPKISAENYAKFIESSKGEVSRAVDLGDSIMTAIAIAPLERWMHGKEFIKFTDLGRLRVQECERVVALRTELTKCGAKVVEEGDTLTVWPSALHGAEIETYDDHRMAMCFAILGLKVPGIKIKNPACVKKTFPNFFQKLAAAPPHGLGAEIWEVNEKGKRTRRLDGKDLFAD